MGPRPTVSKGPCLIKITFFLRKKCLIKITDQLTIDGLDFLEVAFGPERRSSALLFQFQWLSVELLPSLVLKFFPLKK
jgi:hypothetical protein